MSAKEGTYFVWEKTIIEVPYKESVYDYKDDYVVRFYVNGKESKEFDVYREVNGTTLSTVVTSHMGKYIVYYKAVSIEHNISSVMPITFVVVDVNPPIVTLESNTVQLEYGTRLEEVIFYSANDDVYSYQQLEIEIDDSYINYSVLGTYPSKITVADGYGNYTEKDFYVEIIDTTPPAISVLKPLIFEVGSSVNFNDYFMIYDSYNGDVTKFMMISDFDVNAIGRQKIVVSGRDYSDNVVSLSYFVDVVDETPPTIILSTAEVELDIESFSLYDYNFFYDYIDKLYDNNTKIDEIKVLIDYSCLQLSVSDFNITYKAIDKYDNQKEVILNVRLRELNGPDLIAPDEINLSIGEHFDPYSIITVYDKYDNSAGNGLLIYENGLNVNEAGTYYIRYLCYNNSGKMSEKVVKVVVGDGENSFDILSFIDENKSIFVISLVASISIIVFIIIRKIKKHNISRV